MDKDLEKFDELLDSYKNEIISKDDFFDSILKLNAPYYLIHFNKAIAYKRTDETLDKAILEIEEAIKTYPTYGDWRKVKGIGYLPHTKRIRLSRIYSHAGEIYARAGKEDKALACYQKHQYFLYKLKPVTEGDAVVYSFRKYSEYSLADLINNEITVVHPSLMNDPFDSIANLWCTPENLETHCNEKKHLVPLNKSLNYFRIRSFVADKDTFQSKNTILKNILMWSHYTDGHKGFCVKYRLSQHFVKQEENDKFEHMFLKPINYLGAEDNVNLDVESIDTNLSYATKYRCWEYENEVRLISYNTSTNNKFLGIPLDKQSKIEAVYFGYNCSDEQKKTISNILTKYRHKIKLYNTRMNKENVYDLILEEYKEPKD